MNNKEKENKHKKLIKAHHNNIIISDKNLIDKYTHFEDSTLNKTETLLYEIKNKPLKYKRYPRGSIIKAKFGINIGSEFSGEHYAITVSKKDTMMSPVLHVIPITSKKHKKNLYVGNILYSKQELEKLKILSENCHNSTEKLKIKNCIKYYEKRMNNKSYACIDHLKTISKLSICKPINEFDYLQKIKCPNDIMNKIDKEITKEYTI